MLSLYFISAYYLQKNPNIIMVKNEKLSIQGVNGEYGTLQQASE